MAMRDVVPGEAHLQGTMEAAHGIAQEMGETIIGRGFEPVAQHRLHDGQIAPAPAGGAPHRHMVIGRLFPVRHLRAFLPYRLAL